MTVLWIKEAEITVGNTLTTVRVEGSAVVWLVEVTLLTSVLIAVLTVV